MKSEWAPWCKQNFHGHILLTITAAEFQFMQQTLRLFVFAAINGKVTKFKTPTLLLKNRALCI